MVVEYDGFNLPRITFDPTTFKLDIKSQPIKLPRHDKSRGTIGRYLRNGTVAASNASTFDTDWMLRQAKYIAGLSNDDLMTAMAYTTRSYLWLGGYERRGGVPQYTGDMVEGPHIAPLYPQMRKVVDVMGATAFYRDTPAGRAFASSTQNGPARYKAYTQCLRESIFADDALRRALQAYVIDLSRIIDNAPPVRTPFTVFRGVEQDVFSKHVGSTFINPFFQSTTLLTSLAGKYGPEKAGKTGRIERMRLMPGTRALFLATLNLWQKDGELEVLIRKGASYTFRARGAQRWMHTNGTRFAKHRVTNINVR